MIRGAIFDIDGTLIDSMPLWEDLGGRYLRSLGKIPESGLSDILFPMTIPEGVHYIKSRYRLQKTEEEIWKELKETAKTFYREEVPLKAGAKTLLDFFSRHGITMMLATIGEPELVQSALIRLKVWKYFKGMTTCEDLQTTKRESMIYRKAAEIMGTKPEETLVFEDILQAVQSAKKAGFLVCAVADDSSRADRERIAAEADFLIEDFTELSKVIALAGI